MADQRVQQLLRELRDRYGVRVVPEPGPALLELVRELATATGALAQDQARQLRAEAQAFLLGLGTLEERCPRVGPRHEACTLGLGHEQARCSWDQGPLCRAVYRGWGYPIACARPADHAGEHQGDGVVHVIGGETRVQSIRWAGPRPR